MDLISWHFWFGLICGSVSLLSPEINRKQNSPNAWCINPLRKTLLLCVFQHMSIGIFGISYCDVAPVKGSVLEYMGFLLHNASSSRIATTMELNHVCLLFSAFSFSVSALTTDEVSTIRTMLERKVVRGSNVPTALRLTFHDCVGRIWFSTELNLNRRVQWMFECGQPREWWPLGPGGAARNTLRR